MFDGRDLRTEIGRRWGWTVAVAVLALGILGTFLSIRFGERVADVAVGVRGRLLVLPMEGLDPGLQWTMVGLTELSVDALRQVEGLDVVSTERMWTILEQRGVAPDSLRGREILEGLASALGAQLVADPRIARDVDGWHLTLTLRALGGRAREATLDGDDPIDLADRMTVALAEAVALREHAPRFAHFYSGDAFLDRLFALGLSSLRGSGPVAARPAFVLALRQDPRFLSARVALAESERGLGRNESSESLYLESLDDAQDLGRRLLWSRSLIGLAHLAAERDEWGRALELADQALSVQRDLGTRREALTLKHRIQMARGEIEAGRTTLIERLEIEQKVGDRLARAETLLVMAELDRREGKTEEAERTLEAVQAVAREIGDRGLETAALEPLGRLARQRGDFAAARDYWARARSYYEETGSRRRLLLAWEIARATYELNDIEAAEVQLGDVLLLASELKNSSIEAQASILMARLLLEREYPYQARHHVARAVALDRFLGNRLELQRVIAELAFQDGQPDLARRTLEGARSTAGPLWGPEDEANLERYREAALRSDS